MQRSIALVLTVLALAAMPATQAQICTPIEAICTGVTVTTGANAGQGICQININVQINILIAPTTPTPAVIIAPLLGSLVTALVPLPFIGIFPIIWTATPLPGCPGFGLPVTCQTPCSFTNNGAAQGEPHFTGFDGSLFDFQGQPESHYSLLTDQEHNVNGQFVKRGKRLSDNGEEWMDLPTLEDKATWLGSVGVIYKGDTVDIQRLDDAAHTVQVHVNGQEMELEREVSLASGMNITYSNTTVSDGTLWFKPGEWTLPQLTIKTPRYEFVVSSPPNHSRRLDLTSRIIVQSDGTINPAEGVLGRTITAMIDGVGFLDTNITDIVEVWDSEEMDHIRHSATLEAMLSNDYTVSNLWADNAHKSKFNVAEASKPIAAQVTGSQAGEGVPALEASRRRALNEIDPLPINYAPAGASFFAGVINQ